MTVATSAAKRAEVAERRARVLRLRAAGLPYAEIATQTGHKSAAAAAVDCARALRERRESMATESPELVILELERLDTLHRAVESVLGRARAANDSFMVLRAVDRALRISDRRVQLIESGALGKAPEPRDASDELRARREARQLRANGSGERRGGRPGS